jgi:hypothetical protein
MAEAMLEGRAALAEETGEEAPVSEEEQAEVVAEGESEAVETEETTEEA